MAADAVTQVATHTNPISNPSTPPATAGTWVVRGWRLHCASTAGDRAVRRSRLPGAARQGRRALTNATTIVSAVTRSSRRSKTGCGSDGVTIGRGSRPAWPVGPADRADPVAACRSGIDSVAAPARLAAWSIGRAPLRATGAEPTGGSKRLRAPSHRPTSALAIPSIPPHLTKSIKIPVARESAVAVQAAGRIRMPLNGNCPRGEKPS
jgi:hypothetical protein